MITTSKRAFLASKLSATLDRGMIQTGTAPRHSVISRLASALSLGTRMPVPLPIFLMVSSQPTRACFCCRFLSACRNCAAQAFRSINSAVTS